jgi:hypothetical protein
MNKRTNDTPESKPAQSTETREQRLAKGIDYLINADEVSAEQLRKRVRQLAESTARDAQAVLVSLDERGPDETEVTWVVTNARELGEARDKLRLQLDHLRQLRDVVAFASQS